MTENTGFGVGSKECKVCMSFGPVQDMVFQTGIRLDSYPMGQAFYSRKHIKPIQRCLFNLDALKGKCVITDFKSV